MDFKKAYDKVNFMTLGKITVNLNLIRIIWIALRGTKSGVRINETSKRFKGKEGVQERKLLRKVFRGRRIEEKEIK